MTPPLKNTRIERKYGIGTPSLVICGQKFWINIRATPTNDLSTKPITPYTKPDVSEKYHFFRYEKLVTFSLYSYRS